MLESSTIIFVLDLHSFEESSGVVRKLSHYFYLLICPKAERLYKSLDIIFDFPFVRTLNHYFCFDFIQIFYINYSWVLIRSKAQRLFKSSDMIFWNCKASWKSSLFFWLLIHSKAEKLCKILAIIFDFVFVQKLVLEKVQPLFSDSACENLKKKLIICVLSESSAGSNVLPDHTYFSLSYFNRKSDIVFLVAVAFTFLMSLILRVYR